MPIQAAAEAHQAAGVIPAAPWRVKALTVLAEYRLSVTFQDGTSGRVDLSSVLTAQEPGIFEALKDKEFFNQARLDLGVVTWPNGADIDPAWMHEEIRENRLWSVPV
jgi:hypothetical protein